MAERIKGNVEGLPLNSTARTEAIQDACKRLYVLDREIETITDAHLTGLRQHKSDIKKRLREDYQIPARLIGCRYASYKLEQSALDSGDNVTLDAIREMFDALPVGASVDLVDAIARTAS